MSCSVGPQLLCRAGVSLTVAPTSQIPTLLALAWLQPALMQAFQQIPLCTSQQGVPSPFLALFLPSWPGAMLEGRQNYWQQSRLRRASSVQSSWGAHLWGCSTYSVMMSTTGSTYDGVMAHCSLTATCP